MTAEERRARRAQWQSRVVRGGSPEAEQDEDARFELSIPPEDRAVVTWQLSCELYAIAASNGSVDERTARAIDERRLPRSDFRVERR